MRGSDQAGGPGGWASRIGWFLALWLSGVAVVTVVAYAIRWALIS